MAKHLWDFLQKPGKTEVEMDILSCLESDFPIIYLANGQGLNRNNSHLVNSTVEFEFAVDEGISRSDIPVILVPPAHVALTTEIAERYGWSGQIFDLQVFSKLFA